MTYIIYPTYEQASDADLDQLIEWWNGLNYAETPEETRIKNLIYDRMMILANKKTQKEKAHWIAFDAEQKKRKAACPRESATE
jgi:hypothetical protein